MNKKEKPLCICGWEIEDAPYEEWEECGNCDRKLDDLVGLRNLYQQITNWRTIADELAEALRLYTYRDDSGTCACCKADMDYTSHYDQCTVGQALARYNKLQEADDE